jgi:hypothetical protein
MTVANLKQRLGLLCLCEPLAGACVVFLSITVQVLAAALR